MTRFSRVRVNGQLCSYVNTLKEDISCKCEKMPMEKKTLGKPLVYYKYVMNTAGCLCMLLLFICTVWGSDTVFWVFERSSDEIKYSLIKFLQ